MRRMSVELSLSPYRVSDHFTRLRGSLHELLIQRKHALVYVLLKFKPQDLYQFFIPNLPSVAEMDLSNTMSERKLM